jgi:hypothetical protein
MEKPDWPVSAPYLVYAGLNLLVCDLTSTKTAHVTVIPVTRVKEGANSGATLEPVATASHPVPTDLSSDWGALDLMAATATGSDINGYATAGAKRIGYMWVLGAERYLNKLTNYALGF